MNSPPLKYGLLAGMVYFCCMAVAHYFGIKQPLLFVYYDTPFYAYQDKIISFAVVSYIALFYSAAQHRAVVPLQMHWHPCLTKDSPPRPTGYKLG